MPVRAPAASNELRTAAIALPREGPWACTPSGLAQAWHAQPGFFWLDDGQADAEQNGRGGWSYLGLHPARNFESKNGTTTRRDADGTHVETRSALEALTRETNGAFAQAPSATNANEPPFKGGWLTLLGYDLGREIERLPARTEDDLPFPDLYLARYELIFAYDHAHTQWWAAGLDAVPQLRARAAHLAQTLPSPASTPAPESPPSTLVSSNLTRAQYEDAVETALRFIEAGDVYQVNLSQRFQAAWTASPFELYRALRAASPAAYAAYFTLDDARAVTSISPELLLQKRGRRLLTRPIKGTRPRGASPQEDARVADDLQASAKDAAELTMIVDLERNDLGRVCEYGSVRVLSPGELEKHPTVFHRTARIEGTLRAGIDVTTLVRALFPGGSVTGAPKIRAMQIIEELEPVRRHAYCGALGWLGFDGALTWNLAIRTAMTDATRGVAWYHAGCGIVAESDPAAEYTESLAKAKAFFQAVGAPFPPPDEHATAIRQRSTLDT